MAENMEVDSLSEHDRYYRRIRNSSYVVIAVSFILEYHSELTAVSNSSVKFEMSDIGNNLKIHPQLRGVYFFPFFGDGYNLLDGISIFFPPFQLNQIRSKACTI